MLRASQEKKATVIAIQSGQDHCKGSGNEILGARQGLKMQLVVGKNLNMARGAKRRYSTMPSARL
jgi:hypothetical protein